MNFVVPQMLVGGAQTPGTIEQNREWGQQAYNRLLKDALPPSPENYALFFCYYAKRIPDLNMSIDELTKQFGTVTQEQCSDLYLAHVGVEAERKWLEKANSIIEEELKRILDLLGSARTGSDRFGKTLDSFAGQLNTPHTGTSLKNIVDRVAQETRAIAEQNSRLQNQLSQSTQQMSELRYNLDKVRQESLIDPLTEVGNRKFFQDQIERLVQEADSANAPLSLLMLDIDFFKKFNDSHGHLVGDQVLKLVGKTLLENVKGRDVVARYGGEEFAVLLPQTSSEFGFIVGEQLRTMVGNKKITRRSTGESLGTVTLSIGVAQYRSGDTVALLVERADKALYAAKESGRNKVVVAEG